MMRIREETRVFLDEVERSSGKKFLLRKEIALLYELAEQRSLRSVFDDITFYAKFISHASLILRRFGPTSDETTKLSQEFKEKLEKISTLMKSLLDEAPDDMRESFMTRFFFLSRESMNSLMALLQELSWIKNYSLDQARIHK